jgi:hypothetical protein
MSKPFLGKENKFKKVRRWFPLLEAYFEAKAITLDSEKVRVAQSLLRDHALRWWGTLLKKNRKQFLPLFKQGSKRNSMRGSRLTTKS